MSRFKNDDGLKGDLKYTVKKRGNKWEAIRNSKSEGDDLFVDINEVFDDEDGAMQRLWNMKERNVQRISATQRKLALEQREQAALIKEIGNWTPPEPEEPEP